MRELPTDEVTITQQELIKLDMYSLPSINEPQPQGMSSKKPKAFVLVFPRRKNIENT